jgi:hypothetical protein
MATRDDAQTSFRLSSRLLERARVLGDALGIAGQSELIRVALDVGVKQLEDELTIGKATVAVAAIEALLALRPDLKPTLPAIEQARELVRTRDPSGCRVVWRDAVASVRNAIAAIDDIEVALFESDVTRLSVGRMTPIEGANGWASLAVRELLGAERWHRIHVMDSPKAIPSLVVGYWYEHIDDAPISPPPYIPTGAYLPCDGDALRGLDFVDVSGAWLPLSHAATFTYSHSTGLERGRSQTFVTWSERGTRLDRRVVSITRFPPQLIAQQYGRDAATLARKDYDAVELTFEK